MNISGFLNRCKVLISKAIGQCPVPIVGQTACRLTLDISDLSLLTARCGASKVWGFLKQLIVTLEDRGSAVPPNARHHMNRT